MLTYLSNLSSLMSMLTTYTIHALVCIQGCIPKQLLLSILDLKSNVPMKPQHESYQKLFKCRDQGVLKIPKRYLGTYSKTWENENCHRLEANINLLHFFVLQLFSEFFAKKEPPQFLYYLLPDYNSITSFVRINCCTTKCCC